MPDPYIVKLKRRFSFAPEMHSLTAANYLISGKIIQTPPQRCVQSPNLPYNVS
jgi:hypothetical protein